MRRPRRWLLRAMPANDGPLAHQLAERWNERPDLYTSKRAALRTARFYALMIGLPLVFEIVDIRSADGT